MPSPLGKKHNIAIGAHPGLPDIQVFGRREMKLSPEELTALVTYQVGALKGFLDAEGVPLHHVKPHGVLYGESKASFCLSSSRPPLKVCIPNRDKE